MLVFHQVASDGIDKGKEVMVVECILCKYKAKFELSTTETDYRD